MAGKYIIKFDKRLCKGCLICKNFCPVNVFAATDDAKITVAYPDKCIGCRNCENRCPDYALEVLENV